MTANELRELEELVGSVPTTQEELERAIAEMDANNLPEVGEFDDEDWRDVVAREREDDEIF